MDHVYLIRLVLLKRPGFQSQKYGMPVKRDLHEHFFWQLTAKPDGVVV